jgi:hypothetical protein
MRSINHGIKKTIYSIFVILALWPIGIKSAISSPEPDNAALLYYQAFLLRPELDHETFLYYNNVLLGTPPNEKVRDYLNIRETRETLRIAEDATKIPHCSWGMMHPQGIFNLTLSNITSQLRQIAFLLEVDAHTLAVDGDYRAALDRCLSMRRMVYHFADEHDIGYLTSMQLHWKAFDCTQHILSSMSVDRDTLMWLQGQISTVQGPPPPIGRAYEITLEDAIRHLRAHPEDVEIRRKGLLDIIEDESLRQEILSLTDDELLERVKETYKKFLSSVNRVIGSDIPYQQKHMQLKQLEDEFGDDDPIFIILFGYVPTNNVAQHNDIYVRNFANYNALRAAIEIYLINAETGQLPESLPDYLPEDPFSGRDFEYEITNQGFILRCREKEIDADMLWEFEFKVHNNAENN